MHIRLAHPSDLPELADLFRQTVLENGPQHYTSAQTKAWSALDLDRFSSMIFGVTTFVAGDAAQILGFAGLSADGHVASAYVRHDCLRQGIGSALMENLLSHARQQQIPQLYGEASEFSLGLFKKFGFQLYDTEIVERHGVSFTRYLVRLSLTNTQL